LIDAVGTSSSIAIPSSGTAGTSTNVAGLGRRGLVRLPAFAAPSGGPEAGVTAGFAAAFAAAGFASTGLAAAGFAAAGLAEAGLTPPCFSDGWRVGSSSDSWGA
jgi:hypothetical protein